MSSTAENSRLLILSSVDPHPAGQGEHDPVLGAFSLIEQYYVAICFSVSPVSRQAVQSSIGTAPRDR